MKKDAERAYYRDVNPPAYATRLGGSRTHRKLPNGTVTNSRSDAAGRYYADANPIYSPTPGSRVSPAAVNAVTPEIMPKSTGKTSNVEEKPVELTGVYFYDDPVPPVKITPFGGVGEVVESTVPDHVHDPTTRISLKDIEAVSWEEEPAIQLFGSDNPPVSEPSGEKVAAEDEPLKAEEEKPKKRSRRKRDLANDLDGD